MSDDKRRTLCTIDHSGKQFETRRWDANCVWRELARRRRLERERVPAKLRPKPSSPDA